jgi:hypothetical protein
MTGAFRIRAETDGGPLRGGAPRAVWLTLTSVAGENSARSAAGKLVGERRPCHLVWDPATGEIVQLISVLRAARALGVAEWPDRSSHPPPPPPVNTEGRICVQIGVLSHPAVPFTESPLTGVGSIVDWLDSWGIPRRWPGGQPAATGVADHRSRTLWARGGHFGASQVPACENTGPGDIDTDRLTGPYVAAVPARELTSAKVETAAVAACA